MYRVVGSDPNKLIGSVFASTYIPGPDRVDFFIDTFESDIVNAIHSLLTTLVPPLEYIRLTLYNFYTDAEKFYKADDPAVYVDLYSDAYNALELLVSMAGDVSGEVSFHGEPNRVMNSGANQPDTHPTEPEDNGPPPKKVKRDNRKKVRRESRKKAEGERRMTRSQAAKTGVPALHMRP